MSQTMTKRPNRAPSSERYREVIGSLASGVAVITVGAEGEGLGATASAVTSLSLEPPMILVCLDRDSATGGTIDRTGHFAVNVLGEDQGELALRFSGDRERFEEVKPLPGSAAERPLLPGCIAHVECQVTERVTSATHIIFIGFVEGAEAGGGAPLARFRGRFGWLLLDEPGSA